MGDFIFWFDIIVVALVLILGLKGLFNGLVKEIAGLVGIVGGIFIAVRTANISSNIINKMIPNIQNQNLVYVCGLIAVLVIFWALSLIVGGLVSKMLKLSSLGTLDRIGGFIFGASKIFLILAVIFACMTSINFIRGYLKPLEQSSIVYGILDSVGNTIIKTDLFVEGVDKAKSKINSLNNQNIENIQEDFENIAIKESE